MDDYEQRRELAEQIERSRPTNADQAEAELIQHIRNQLLATERVDNDARAWEFEDLSDDAPAWEFADLIGPLERVDSEPGSGERRYLEGRWLWYVSSTGKVRFQLRE